VLGSAHRVAAMFGGWLAAVSGAWFIVGPPLSQLWGSPTIGDPTGGTTRRTMEYIAFFGGLGAVIVFLAAFALARFAVVGVREAELARAATTEEEYEAVPTTRATTTTPPATSTATSTEPDAEAETTGRHHLLWHRSKHAAVR